ncbi:ABC transporter ATP-binding protein [Nocardiopsis dassonvillei]|uniref:ABC transporter ATP-binding protein n=1 Tax=Nocardiopsis dassonvillei TaxID=2014 RepID=UPI0033CB2E34
MENESRVTSRVRPETVSWVGLGLVSGGILLAAVDMVRFPLMEEELTTPDGGLWWLAAVLLGAIVLCVVLRRDAWERQAGPATRLDRTRTVLLLAVSVLLLYVAYTAFSPMTFSWTAENPRFYFPDAAGVSLWTATLAITLGAILMAATAHQPRLRPLPGSVPPMAGGLVLVLLLEFGLGAATLYQPTEHTIADAFPDTPAPVPGDVSGVGWEWEVPQDVSVRGVEPGPFGPLLTLEDGVVALDGSSGEVLWSYRHPYNSWVRVVISDGGTRALVTRQPVADRSGDHHVTEIDTVTGGILREFTVPPLLEEGEDEDEETRVDFLAGTSEVSLYSWRDTSEEQRVRVHATDSNEELWFPTVPESRDRTCVNFGGWQSGENLLLHEDQVLITYLCADEDRLDEDTTLRDLTLDNREPLTGVVAAFDARTGEENWIREWDDTNTELSISVDRPVPGTDSHPVVVAQGRYRSDVPRALDLRDGSDSLELPPELMDSETMSDDFEQLVRVGSESTVLLSRGPADQGNGDEREPFLFHRVSASGEITAMAEMPFSTVFLDQLPEAIALGEAVIIPRLEYEETGTQETIPAVVVIPYDAGPDAVRTIRFDEPEFASEPGMDGARTGDHRAIPAPGAVVTYVQGTETTIVRGLVG